MADTILGSPSIHLVIYIALNRQIDKYKAILRNYSVCSVDASE